MIAKPREQTSLYNGVWVEGDGDRSASIVLIGRDPGAKELIAGKPFVGPAGQMLQECAAEANIPWDSVFRTNVMRCQSPGNEKPTEEQMDEYMPWLVEELFSLPNAKVLVILGNEAMKAITKKSGITDKRGEEFEITIEGRTFTALPAFHPSYILRKRAMRPVLVKDLVRARRLSRGEPMLDTGRVHWLFQGLPTYYLSSHSDYLDGFRGQRICVDVETDEHDRLRIVGAGSDPQMVYMVRASEVQDFFSRLNPNWYLGHNIRSDLRWLRKAGVVIPPLKIQDTILKAHLLNENRPMSLKKLELELLDPEIYWRMIETRLRKPQTRGAIPEEELGEYCADDVGGNLLIDDVLSEQLARQPRLEALYNHMSLPLSNVLLDVEMHGMLIDRSAAETMQSTLTVELTMMDAHLGSAVKNWNSDAQVAAHLYGTLGLKPPHLTKNKTRGSVDQEALMALRFQHPIVQPLIDRALMSKKIEIVGSILNHMQGDNRIYPTFNQAGPVNARLAAHDPNVQNIPTEQRFRALIVAPDGYSILSADYKTLEIGIGGWVFQADDLLNAYLSGDVHTITATALLGRPPRDKDERKKWGKTPNFGLEYQQGDDGFREYAAKKGLTLTADEARAMRAAWHALYPGVRAGWRRIGMDMKANNGIVTSPSGRMRRLPEFMSGSQKLVNEAWRMGCNFPVSCTAVELAHISAIIGAPFLAALGARMIQHGHDALLFEVPTENVWSAARELRDVMERQAPEYFEKHFGTHIPIPLHAEISAGPNWGHLTEVA